jgi:ATP-dependent Lhr-like helicase
VRLPDTESEPPGTELFLFEKDELDELVTVEVGGSAMFASRFRECAARALLLPRRNPSQRSPLWQQRQRASQLLEVAREFPDFPIILETVREVLGDVYDLPSLTQLTDRIRQRSVRLVEVETPTPSPFARSLLFGYVAAFLYEGDSPLAERRAAALSIDSALLAELLGRAELREVLDPTVIEQTEAELQRLAPDRRARDAEGVVDLLRLLGPLSLEELVERTSVEGAPRPADHADAVASWLRDLGRANRVLAVSIAGVARHAVVEDAARLRDALGTPVPIGVPTAFLESVVDPIGDLVARHARTHGPFVAQDVAHRFGLGIAVVVDALRRLAGERRLLEGEFRPGASGTEWVDVEVLRRLRTRSLAALRSEIEPVSGGTLGRFLPSWQNVGGGLRGVDGVLQAVEQLQGVALPASAWESLVLPSRVRDYSPAWLDELTAAGELVWAGEGSLAGNDGWLSLHLAETAPLSLRAASLHDASPSQQAILTALSGGGAYFFRQLSDAVNSQGDLERVDDAALAEDLWQLVWAGLLTNDTLAPVRAMLGATRQRATAPRRPPRSRSYRGYARPASVSRTGPPTAAGRWSLVPDRDVDATRRAAHLAETLLERHGIVTRGAAQAEQVVGGFALLYRVLSRMEEAGRVRRGYFVEHLGAAQFATPATVDRVRAHSRDPDSAPALHAITIAASDPANPYGAALPWPAPQIDPADAARGASPSHRAGRKAGAVVVLVDGHLAVYLERGGKSALTFTADPAVLEAAATELAAAVRARLRSLRVERVNSQSVFGTPLAEALTTAGFVATPQGLRLRV